LGIHVLALIKNMHQFFKVKISFWRYFRSNFFH
jgi:hypothetical protein